MNDDDQGYDEPDQIGHPERCDLCRKYTPLPEWKANDGYCAACNASN